MSGLNDSDLRILRFIGQFRFVPTRVIEKECFGHQTEKSAQAWVSRCLKKLRGLGLLHSVQAFGVTYVHFVTESGAELVGVEGAGGGVKLAEYFHDLAVLELWRVLNERSNIDGLVTEKVARAVELDPALNPYSISITRLSGKQGIAWPDLVSGEKGSFTGYEVEYSAKNRRRLVHLMAGYGYSDAYRHAVYFTVPQSENVVVECAEEANRILQARGLGRPITTRRLGDYVDLEVLR